MLGAPRQTHQAWQPRAVNMRLCATDPFTFTEQMDDRCAPAAIPRVVQREGNDLRTRARIHPRSVKTAGAAKNQIPMCSLQPRPCSQVKDFAGSIRDPDAWMFASETAPGDFDSRLGGQGTVKLGHAAELR
jgi:hypothetical protein